MKQSLKEFKATELIEDPKRFKMLARQMAYGEKQRLVEELLAIAMCEESRADLATAKRILKLVMDLAREGKNYEIARARIIRIDRTIGVVRLVEAEDRYDQGDLEGFFRRLRGAEALGLTANVLSTLYAVEKQICDFTDSSDFTAAKWIKKITDWAIANRTKSLAMEIARVACANGDMRFCEKVERLNGRLANEQRIPRKPKGLRCGKLTLFMNPFNGK